MSNRHSSPSPPDCVGRGIASLALACMALALFAAPASARVIICSFTLLLLAYAVGTTLRAFNIADYLGMPPIAVLLRVWRAATMARWPSCTIGTAGSSTPSR